MSDEEIFELNYLAVIAESDAILSQNDYERFNYLILKSKLSTEL